MQNITKVHYRTYVKILSKQSQACEVSWRLVVEHINVSLRGNHGQSPRIGGKAKRAGCLIRLMSRQSNAIHLFTAIH